MSPPPCRVILLLDLDCFYAQCERVRLGLDPDASLALLQWNSALAVTYPARRLYNIKRGDSWDVIREKSKADCLTLHLPLLTNNSTSTVQNEESIEEAYNQVYCTSPEQQVRMRQEELGVRRYSHEGKACLELYRLASSRIFSTVLEALVQHLGENSFILERASIDELFLDVTNYCWNDNVTIDDTIMKSTVAVGSIDSDDPDVCKALQRGCVVAHAVRKHVFDTLGFTLSAGCSTSKLVAKLGASYGKPNGQAVILPSGIPLVMKRTEIRKVRNFGGKIGKQVQALLPPDRTTMDDVAQLLSLPVLCDKLGETTGKMVFDACRGVDDEPIKETVGALVKSITAFKSFSKTKVTSGEVTEWISLLAKDVVSRVQMDSVRNSRYPKTCTVQYAFSPDNSFERITRSVRIPFPKEDTETKLAQRAKDAIVAKEGQVFLYRIGLSVTDFQPRPNHGSIDSFFSRAKNEAKSNGNEDSAAAGSQDEELAQKPQAQREANQKSAEAMRNPTKVAVPPKSQEKAEVDRDLELARKLQASYDRENHVLTEAEKRQRKQQQEPSKKRRIDSFFQKT